MDKIKTNIKEKKQLIFKWQTIRLLMFVVFINLIFLPHSWIIANVKENNQKGIVRTNQSVVVLAKESKKQIKEKKEEKIAWSQRYIITAYSSDIFQCDSSPCVTANGFNVCEHAVEDTVAANFLKFGTRIRIPELFGDKIFIVRDRMNKRYVNRIDVWLKHKDNAIDFGVKYPIIEVLE